MLEHLCYCTNIHPAETWEETFAALKEHTLKVRDEVNKATGKDQPYPIGLRLSAQAAKELLELNDDEQPYLLEEFKSWLTAENLYVYTINGFPYGAFHNTRVKEQVYAPDWTTKERVEYTAYLFIIIAELAPKEIGGSVSTLPGSFKEFEANEHLIFRNLYSTAIFVAALAEEYDKDLHLGLEPEPLGHFENTEETLTFFERFHQWAVDRGLDTDIIYQHIGINYDTCHFALQYEDAATALNSLTQTGLRISKIHLSNAIEINASSEEALEAIKAFEEPTYLHQVMVKGGDTIERYRDLPEFFEAEDKGERIKGKVVHDEAADDGCQHDEKSAARRHSHGLPQDASATFTADDQRMSKANASNKQVQATADDREGVQALTARVHFHIPLHAQPSAPLGSTIQHTIDTLEYLKQNPDTCTHLEMETYTWGVLPDELQVPIEQQLTQEHLWVLEQANK
mgnify:CR=1 FL=1